MDLVVLALAFLIILLGAELFTNGIEWFGRKLELAEGAVGSVLAAVGTALPETMIPIIAILFASGEASHAVGIGAILGAPFMLATLAMFVTGIAVLASARRRSTGDTMQVDTHVLAHDMRYFAIAYALADRRRLPAPRAGLAQVDRRGPAHRHLRVVRQGPLRGRPGRRCRGPGAAPLPAPRSRTPTARTRRSRGCGWSTCRSSRALALIIIGAVFFVDAVDHIASTLGIDEVLLALVIAPIATELPEKFNSVIWVRAGKDTLAMGNITGAMVFQSCIPTVVALVFASSSWVAAPGSYLAFASAGIAFLASAVIFIPMARSGRLRGRNLLSGGAFYLAYLAVVIVAIVGGMG